jgi:hypothetical protein
LSIAQHILDLYEVIGHIPLPQTKVLAHIAGPSGSGKTEISYALSKNITNIDFKDLDEFDEEAVKSFGWENIPKNDYTDTMLKRLGTKKQALLNAYLKQTRKPVIFVGHHVESDHILKFPAGVRVLLSVSPRTAALRRHKTQGYTKERLHQDIGIGKEDVTYLKTQGYIAMPPQKVYTLIMRWSKELKNDRTRREP